MPASILLEFTWDENELAEDLERKASDSVFDCIEIVNIPTTYLALQWIYKNLYEVIISPDNIFGIIFNIYEKLDENFNFITRNTDFQNKSKFLVAFQSNIGNRETKVYWKFPGIEEFRSVFVEGDIGSMLCDFLIQEIKAGRSGTKETNTKNKIRLHELVNQQNEDLLKIAVRKCQNNVVLALLRNDFIADNAIDLAWNLYLVSDDDEKSFRNQIILSLLAANSSLPKEFEYDRASSEVQGFINWCEDLQRDIDNDDLRALKAKLDAYPNLSCFYDRTNQSLLAYAIRFNKTKIFKKFARRLNTGSHEDFERIYETIQSRDKWSMHKKREENPFNFPQTHLLVLKSRTKISSNDQNACRHWEYIDEAYQTINNIEYCSVILQVTAECKSVKIFFDFKHDSTYYMDPATSIYSKGIIYEGGTIYIGAQDLLAEESKFKVFGVIVHEFCHLAVYLAFMNRNFDPFPTGESELKRRFVEQVMVQCKVNEALESIIGNVFRSYPKEIQNSEMIVTYPQILMHYYGSNTRNNEIEEFFSELVKYSKEVVEPELIKSLKVLKCLNDESRLIKYKNLTVPMKAKIVHTKIDFQGTKTTFHELIGQSEEIMEALLSDDIKSILLKHQSNKIGEELKLEMEYGIICRNFEKVIEANQNDQEDKGPRKKKRKISKPKLAKLKTESRTFEQVKDETLNSKIFLLADHAGSGKTTIFKDCTKKLKEFFKNFWVSFVNLRKHGKIFEEYKAKIEILTLNDVVEILLKIVNPKPGLEASICNKLFNEGRTIFLFDGVDEISPIYTELLLKLFTILNQMEPKNQMWISTRPHYAQKLSDTLNIPYHKFTQYQASEINEFIKEILKFHKVTDKDAFLIQIKNCMRGLKGFYYEAGESKEIENPLMVQMVTELYIDKKVDPDNISRYGVYEAMVDKQKEKVGEKIPYLEHNQDNNLNIWDIHRVLALILIIGNDYKKELKFELEDLEIMRKWKEEKHKWTPDMIQRYGFVIVDLSNDIVDRGSIDFMHRTYAEFFVTQIFAKFLRNDNREIYLDPKLITLFYAIMRRKKKFNVIKDFLLSFTKGIPIEIKEVCCEQIKKICLPEIHKIHQEHSSYELSRLLGKFLNDYAEIDKVFGSKIFNELWKLDEETNLLEEYFKLKNMEYDTEIIDLAEKCYGSSWHEKFNKSGIKLITDDEILKLKSTVNKSGNLLKFCDLLNKNYKIENKKKFYLKIFINLYSTEVQTEIISRAHDTFDRTEFCQIFFLNTHLNYIDHENIKQILEIIENDFKNDENLLQKLLFENPEKSKSPLCQYFRDFVANENFKLIKDFYIKHKTSWRVIQDILVDDYAKNFKNPFFSLYYSDFKELVINAFGTDFSRLAANFEDFVNNGGNFMCFYKEDLEDFLNLIFHNDIERVTNIMNKLF